MMSMPDHAHHRPEKGAKLRMAFDKHEKTESEKTEHTEETKRSARLPSKGFSRGSRSTRLKAAMQ